MKTQAGREVVPARKVGIADALLKATGTNPIWISEERSRQYALRSEQSSVDAVKRRFNAEPGPRVRSGAGRGPAAAETVTRGDQGVECPQADLSPLQRAKEQRAIKRLVKEELGVSEGIKLRKSYRQRGVAVGGVCE